MVVRLSCFGRKDLPIFSYEFYKDTVPVGTTRVVINPDYKKIATASEIAEWLVESCSGNVFCCRHVQNFMTHNKHYYEQTTVAIYFEDINDMLMFKLSYHEIIYEFVTKTDTFAPIDKINISKHKRK